MLDRTVESSYPSMLSSAPSPVPILRSIFRVMCLDQAFEIGRRLHA
jgi:hypothetical protein